MKFTSKICYEWPNNTVTHECAHLRDVKMFVVIPVFFFICRYLETKILEWKQTLNNEYSPTWSKNSANSQCKAWICKKYHGY
jgi:hypothetical protein